MSEHSTTAFFDVWHTYRKVVAANYMHHMEIKAHIEQMLHAQFVGRPFSFLDLGCGDAATLAPLLASMAVQRYKGVDLSESALALAAENLKALSCPVELVCGDILAALEADTGLYDVVYTSFAFLRNLSALTQYLAELRGLYGSGHGRDGKHRGLEPRHARLAVGAAAAFIEFVTETHHQRDNLK